jgi:hypothetical protein
MMAGIKPRTQPLGRVRVLGVLASVWDTVVCGILFYGALQLIPNTTTLTAAAIFFMSGLAFLWLGLVIAFANTSRQLWLTILAIGTSGYLLAAFGLVGLAWLVVVGEFGLVDTTGAALLTWLILLGILGPPAAAAVWAMSSNEA